MPIYPHCPGSITEWPLTASGGRGEGRGQATPVSHLSRARWPKKYATEAAMIYDGFIRHRLTKARGEALVVYHRHSARAFVIDPPVLSHISNTPPPPPPYSRPRGRVCLTDPTSPRPPPPLPLQFQSCFFSMGFVCAEQLVFSISLMK